MSEHAGHSNARDEAAPEAGRRSTEGTPRWVKVFGIVAVVVVLLFVILLIVGGPHGPSRHVGDRASQTTLDAA